MCGQCPFCKHAMPRWAINRKYKKYCGQISLAILQVRCFYCKRKHAVIPAFSVPNASHAINDLEVYFSGRNAGLSRRKAAKGLSLEQFSYTTLKRLDQRIDLRSKVLKACDPMPSIETLHGYAFLQAKAGGSTPIDALNQHYIVTEGRGWLFGNLGWLYRHRTVGIPTSYTLDTPQNTISLLDSS
jgi:hypothetical protein